MASPIATITPMGVRASVRSCQDLAMSVGESYLCPIVAVYTYTISLMTIEIPATQSTSTEGRSTSSPPRMERMDSIPSFIRSMATQNSAKPMSRDANDSNLPRPYAKRGLFPFAEKLSRSSTMALLARSDREWMLAETIAMLCPKIPAVA